MVALGPKAIIFWTDQLTGSRSSSRRALNEMSSSLLSESGQTLSLLRRVSNFNCVELSNRNWAHSVGSGRALHFTEARRSNVCNSTMPSGLVDGS